MCTPRQQSSLVVNLHNQTRYICAFQRPWWGKDRRPRSKREKERGKGNQVPSRSAVSQGKGYEIFGLKKHPQCFAFQAHGGGKVVPKAVRGTGAPCGAMPLWQHSGGVGGETPCHGSLLGTVVLCSEAEVKTASSLFFPLDCWPVDSGPWRRSEQPLGTFFLFLEG